MVPKIVFCTLYHWGFRTRARLRRRFPLADIQSKVANAHESLGMTVTRDPVELRLESRDCIDIQIIDLPGALTFGRCNRIDAKRISSHAKRCNRGL